MSGVPRGILRRLPIIAWYGVDGGIYEFRSINEWTGLAEGMIRRILPPRDALQGQVPPSPARYAGAKEISTPRQLLKSLDQALALEAGEAVDPEQAVELIDLMLMADGA